MLCAFLVSPSVQASAADVRLVINGTVVEPDVNPRIVDGRTLVPVRVIGESLDWDCVWDPDSQQVKITNGSRKVVLTVGLPLAVVDRRAVLLDVAPTIVSGRTMVPVRFVVEAFDAVVEWDGSTRTVSIASLGPPSAPVEGPEGDPGVSFHRDEAGTRVSIMVAGSCRIVDVPQDDPCRIALRLEGVLFPLDQQGSIHPQEGPVKQVTVRSDSRSSTSLVAVDLEYPLEHRLVAGNSGGTLYIAEVLGLEPALSDTHTDIAIRTTGSPQPRVFTLREPHRVVVDLAGTELTPHCERALGELAGVGGIASVRYGRHKAYLGDEFTGIRLVIETGSELAPSISPGDEAGVWMLRLLPPSMQSLEGVTVVLDPGHGGSDPGAESPGGFWEKDIDLQIALRCAERLRAQGAEVHLTRTSDVTVGVYDRPAIANVHGADIFISLHNNALNYGTKNGTETYYYPNHDRSPYLAQCLHESIVATLGRPDRGVRYGNYAVLREARMPAALMEILYLSSPEEERLLLNPRIHDRIAEAVVSGIVRFLGVR